MTAGARSALTRLKLGQDVRCSDGPAGKLCDVVIDPNPRRVTHLVVQPHSQPARAHLLPVELAGGDAGDGGLALQCTTEQLRAAPLVRETGRPAAHPPQPDGGEEWDVGIREAVVMPRLDAGVFVEYTPDRGPDVMTTYDRVPKGEVEIRRSSSVTMQDGSDAGVVDGFLLDGGGITHLLVERGHFWHRRIVAVPIDAVESLRTDDLVVALSKAQLDALGAA